MSALVRDWRDLVALPVGSVVLARHKSYGDTWSWSKTDDTELRDEDGERASAAWASVAYHDDLSDADLLIQSDAVMVIWHGDSAFPPEVTP